VASHVAICIPSGDMVHTDFMLSLIHVMQKARMTGFRISVVNSKASIVAIGRNLAVKAGRETRAEWLLFLDSDMIFPAETIERLISHGRDVVGATYPRKILPLAFIGNRLDGVPFSLADKGVIEATRLPAGCLLIKRDIFDRMQEPFFRCGYDEKSGEILGEDFWFSDRVRALGYSLWCDMELSLHVEHIGSYRFNLHE
jgi:hypothetical protein